ncbi:hypothetical protein AAG747_19010 [Rapidithrix thailandica]|uniref:TraB/GumN family protein n=1 Tax=Rapidithrix thailandica TaxID=413964 RepID=A0AAW9S1P1_9BACT
MKNLLILILWILITSCHTKKTELVLLGTVHQPIDNFTPDSLYNILQTIAPELILFEVDSSFFTSDFQFKKNWNSNENLSTVRYMNDYDVDIRPYDFTGRNEYRVKIGARPTDSKAIKLLDSLYNENLLNSSERKTYEEYSILTDTLMAFTYLGANAFNNVQTDSIAEIRQHYQYEKLLTILRNNPIFSSMFLVKNDGDSISYAEGYKRAGEFWHLRNKTMANNILSFIKKYKGKRIVVLNDYFHRYYLHALLATQQREHNFVIRNFYDY